MDIPQVWRLWAMRGMTSSCLFGSAHGVFHFVFFRLYVLWTSSFIKNGQSWFHQELQICGAINAMNISLKLIKRSVFLDIPQPSVFPLLMVLVLMASLKEVVCSALAVQKDTHFSYWTVRV